MSDRLTSPATSESEQLADYFRRADIVSLQMPNESGKAWYQILNGDQVTAIIKALSPLSESAATDTARLDFLAEITNLSALRDCGHMLPGDKVRKIEKTAEALSAGYEVNRRTMDTPQAFRLAVDQAMKETGHG